MRIDVISLFSDMFSIACNYGVIGRARTQSLWKLHAWNPRDFSKDPRRNVDDHAYGGGAGMVMLAEPLEDTIEWILKDRIQDGLLNSPPIVLLSPKGSIFNQESAKNFSSGSGVVLVCGRYKGVDQRFIDRCVTHEISLGDFIMSGGELAALAIIDAIIRLLPGVLNNSCSPLQDSFAEANKGLLDSPCYTRPRIYKNLQVPNPLLTGNHSLIERWRRKESLVLTAKRRPELIESARKKGLIDESEEFFLENLERNDSYS